MPKSPSFLLKVIFPTDTELQLEVDSQPRLIGRSLDAHLKLDDELISRRQCLIWTENGSVFVEDLNSTNGTSIDGFAIAGKNILNPSQSLQIGTFILKCEPILTLNASVDDEFYMQKWCPELAPKPLFEEQMNAYFADATSQGAPCALILTSVKNIDVLLQKYSDDAVAFCLNEVYKMIDKERISDELLGCFMPNTFALALRDIAPAQAEQFAKSLLAQIQNHRYRFGDDLMDIQFTTEYRVNQ
jgi:hypothetical protein